MPDPVPGEPLVGVGGILPPRDPFGPEVVPERFAAEREERSDDPVGPPRPDSAAGPADPALEVEEHRLGLVLQGVPGGQEGAGTEVAPERQERLVPEPSRRGFQALARDAQVAYREAPEYEGKTELRGEIGGGPGVPVALFSAQLVVDVERHERKVTERCFPDEQREEGGGIGPARAGGDESRGSVEKAGSGEVAGKRVSQGCRLRREGVDGGPHPRMVGETGRAGRIGGDGRTRTADTGLMRPPLYRLSYIATSRPQSREWYQSRAL